MRKLLCLVGVMAVALIGVIGPSAPSSAAMSAAWAVARQYPLAAMDVNDVSCVSVQDCVAVSQSDADAGQVPTGIILHSTDGGATWHTQSTLAGVEGLTGIA